MTASPPAAEQYAKKSDAPGLPSEEEIARALMKQFYEDWFAPGRPAHNGSVYWDFVNGESAWRQQAAVVAALIRPAFERLSFENSRLAVEADRNEVGWNVAETKLAQAVEDEREACALAAEDKANTLDFRARASISAAIRARSASAAARD